MTEEQFEVICAYLGLIYSAIIKDRDSADKCMRVIDKAGYKIKP